MRPNFERQSINFKRSVPPESIVRTRYISEQAGRRAYPPLSQQEAAAQRRKLTEEYLAHRKRGERLVTPEQSEIEAQLDLGNKELPSYQKKAEIQKAVLENQVTIVVGETGSGKSTQVPQYLLEAGFHVEMTQPRIMAANGVGQRITDELAEHFGQEDAEALVGVHTSEKNTIGSDTRVSVFTDGLELVQSGYRQASTDPENVTVKITDEVHEFNTNIELNLAFQKRQVAMDPHARLVIMSATLDAKGLSDYFGDVTETPPPIIEIEGKPQQLEFIEEPDSTIVEEAVKYAHTSDSILVFVPGVAEIKDTLNKISEQLPAHIRDTALLLPLSAKMSENEQNKVYQEVNGVKIIVATNVAQTSITIPGVKVVIDSGLERRKELDDEDTEGLLRRESSIDSCRQKGGRTGRDVPGIWVLTRYDADTPFTPLSEREQHTPAQIYSTDLARNVLLTQVLYDVDFADLDLYHQVRDRAIRNAKDTLYSLQALDDDEQVLQMGREMNKFSMRPRFSRMMVESLKPGYPKAIGAYMAAITASMEAGGLQHFGPDIGTRWKELVRDETDADPIAQLDLFMATRGFDTEDETYGTILADYDLDLKNVATAHNQYRKICRIIGVDPYESLEAPTVDEIEVLKDCIYTGMAESVYAKSGRSGKKATYLRMGPDEKMTERTLSNRSIVRDEPSIVAATPRRFERYKDGEMVEEHILEIITPGDRERLARTALHLCETMSAGFVLRGDKVMQRQQQTLYGEKVGPANEVAAEWSPELREYLVKNALENPGPAQRELRAIKKELEELQQLTNEPLPKIQQSDLVQWLEEAADSGVTSPSQFDSYLGTLMRQTGLSLTDVQQSERFAKIREQAPSYLSLSDGSHVTVKYQGERPPVVKLSDIVTADSLPDRLQLPDGREVYVSLAKSDRGQRMIPFTEFRRTMYS